MQCRVRKSFHVAFWIGTAIHLNLTVLDWEHEFVDTVSDGTFTRDLGAVVCFLGALLVAGGILTDAESASHRRF
tara:strand:- start:154 stop:375 length:222 start_codon:yes stop_codon:yes gene_type:complete